MKIKLLILLLTFVTILTSCDEKDYIVVIHTEYGDMKAVLYEETPQHKKSFLELAKGGYYDSLLFHRVMQGFMVQGGDPDSRNAPANKNLGSGGPGYTIPAEILPQFYHTKGTLSAARLPDQMNPEKASSGSQFYIVQGEKFTEEELQEQVDNAKYGRCVTLLNKMFTDGKQQDLLNSILSLQQTGDAEAVKEKVYESIPIIEQEFGKQTFATFTPEKIHDYETIGGAPHLDGEYTIFGKVVEGLDVIDKIASQPTNQRNRPLKDIHMVIELQEMSRKDITKKYGYKYPEDK